MISNARILSFQEKMRKQNYFIYIMIIRNKEIKEKPIFEYHPGRRLNKYIKKISCLMYYQNLRSRDYLQSIIGLESNTCIDFLLFLLFNFNFTFPFIYISSLFLYMYVCSSYKCDMLVKLTFKYTKSEARYRVQHRLKLNIILSYLEIKH